MADGSKVRGAGWSLSARRAWIEIGKLPVWLLFKMVALRKESVDRNSDVKWKIVATYKSLSARRAWIEISGR